MKRHITAGIAVLLGLMALMPAQLSLAPTPARAQIAGLHMQGVNIVNVSGDRFIAAGLNVEAYRDYDNGCDWTTDGYYSIRAAMSDRIKGLGVNVVRLNYAYRFLASADAMNKYLDIATELAMRGIYVMPADHTYTSDVLVNSSGSFPTMLRIVEGMRARGIENYLIMGGWNEPGPDIAIGAWERAYQNLLTYLRRTALFDGLVVVDGTGWSTLLDVDAFQRVQAFDATLRGGSANVVFSHHLYPNITDLPAKLWTAANQVPLIVGELGQENPGASPLKPQYVKDVIAGFLNAGLANGHNGLFAWQWNWCDINTLLDDDWKDASGQASSVPYTANSPLTSHGVLWRDNYYSKLPGGYIPPPATVIVQVPTSTRTPTPTRSVVPTNTPRPRSPTPTRTEVPVVIVTNTPAPTGVVGCVATMIRDVVFNGRPARETVCITYQ